jgi:hypothetical protein
MGQLAAKEYCVDKVGVRKDGPVLDFSSGDLATETTLSNTLAIGGGCFWGVEHYMTRSKF